MNATMFSNAMSMKDSFIGIRYRSSLKPGSRSSLKSGSSGVQGASGMSMPGSGALKPLLLRFWNCQEDILV